MTKVGLVQLHKQAYSPFRGAILDREQLRALSELRPRIVVRDTLLLWLTILAAWTVVAIWTYWWTVMLAIPIIGTRYYALYIIGHDGLHRRLFKTQAANDLWNDVFALGAVGAITRLNRLNHMTHHDTLALDHDPDRYKYASANRVTRGQLILALTGLPYVGRSTANIFRPKAAAARKDCHGARDVIILIAWQLALIGGLTLAIGWWAYPVLWLVPVYAFTFAADMARVFLEHARHGNDQEGDRSMRLTSFSSNIIERQFFAPQNMNYHAAHHLWPSIPYYHLQEADRLMRSSPLRDDRLVWRSSYVACLVHYLRTPPGSAS